MRLVMFAFIALGSVSNVFAADCNSNEQVLLNCTSVPGIKSAPGYPTALVLCKSQAGQRLVLDIGGQGTVSEGGVTTSHDSEGPIYSSKHGSFVVQATQNMSFVALQRNGANMGVLQCR